MLSTEILELSDLVASFSLYEHTARSCNFAVTTELGVGKSGFEPKTDLSSHTSVLHEVRGPTDQRAPWLPNHQQATRSFPRDP